MSESTSQRNKAIWIGSLALLTVGSVLYFTLLRKPEDSSKPAKDTKSRQVVKDKPVKRSEAEVKDDSPQKGDVPQAKATVTSKEVATPNATQLSDTLDSEKSTERQQDTTASDNAQDIEKSPILTAAPSSSSSSDVNPSSVGEQQEPISNSDTTTATTLTSNPSGADVNGYWQPPTNNATFQHSMGWPELFPLQQQENNETKSAPADTINKDITATVNGEKATAAISTPTGPTEKKKHTKKRMTRMEQIDQQRQSYVPTMKSRCNWWPNCTNKNCKYHHPYQICRYGDMCIYNERCMFLHPWDIEEPVRQPKQHQHQQQQLQHAAN